MIVADQLEKRIPTLASPIDILKGVSLSIDEGSAVAILGASGSGKTTLLSILAGLDTPTSGEVIFNQQNLSRMTEDERCTLRKGHVGFIFQQFELLPSLTALENVMLPAELSQLPNPKQLAMQALEQVGLSERIQHYPNQLSGGEQQRVAIARAFVTTPKIVFADEPTGCLDEQTGNKIIDLMFSLKDKLKTTLVFVTHDLLLAKRCDKIFQLKGGKIVS